jgi:hypothetical protein
MWFEQQDVVSVKLKILDQRLFDLLIKEVPCRVGGMYLYSEEALLEGTLDAEGQSVLQIIHVRIVREEETFEFQR